MNNMLQINEIKKFKHFTFIARVNIPNDDCDQLMTIQLKAENDIDMIDEVEETIKVMEKSNIEYIWYKVMNNKNGLVVA